VEEEVSAEHTTVQTSKEQVELEKTELPSENSTTPEDTRDVADEVEGQESQM